MGALRSQVEADSAPCHRNLSKVSQHVTDGARN